MLRLFPAVGDQAKIFAFADTLPCRREIKRGEARQLLHHLLTFTFTLL